jgi:hypothetical protein
MVSHKPVAREACRKADRTEAGCSLSIAPTIAGVFELGKATTAGRLAQVWDWK